MTQNNAKTLVEGLERLGLMATQIRKNGDAVTQIEIDIILQELRDLYMAAVMSSRELSVRDEMAADDATRTAAIEAARRQAEEEEAARRRKAEEEAAAARKAEEEEAARRRKAEEEAAAARRKAEEEEAARRHKAEEEAAAARRKAEEEEAARRKAEEDAKPVFAPDEKPATEAPQPSAQMESLEGNPNDSLFADEAEAPQPKPAQQGNTLFSYLNNSPREEKPTVRTIADTLPTSGRNVEEQLERKVNAKKVDDLRTIININDKFSFMSELFHNNMKAYNDFILRLNGYVDRQQALDYVADIATQQKWDNESLAVKNFYKVFDRKF